MNQSNFALLKAGHRPFFLFAVISAVVLMATWLAAFGGRVELSSLWHAHEMTYGFAGAAIAGFLLAAVPNWTKAKSPTGLPLIIIFLIWFMGRIGFLMAELDPAYEMLAYVDLLFMPIITVIAGKMIIGAKNKRNMIIIAILIGYCLTNFFYHAGYETESVRAGIYMILLLAALIGGRVVPAFTENAIRKDRGEEIKCPTPKWTHPVLMGLITLAAILEYVDLGDMTHGSVALITALILFYRMMKWNAAKTLYDPIVWILHVAYFWLPLGFALKAISYFTEYLLTTALHALSVGAIGLLFVAIASRAALGHAGYEIKAAPPTVVAYIVLIAATLVRVFMDNTMGIMISGTLWMIGFALIAYVYAPILMRARIDGQPG